MRVRTSWYSCQPPIPETHLDVVVKGKQSARAIAKAQLAKKYHPSRPYFIEWKPDQVLSDEPAGRTSWLDQSQPREQ